MVRQIVPLVLAGLLGGGLGGSLIASASHPVSSTPTNQTVTTVGTGIDTLTPDIAKLTLGETTRGSNAQAALAQSSQTTRAVMHALTAEGVSASDIKTSEISLWPQYRSSSQGEGIIQGYQVSDNLTVTVRNLANLGTIVDKAVAAGANQINGVAFTSSNLKNVYQKTYGEAMDNARARAQVIAAAMGEHIAGIRSVSTSTASSLPLSYRYAFNSVAAPSAPVLPAGKQTVTRQVTVVFDVAP